MSPDDKVFIAGDRSPVAIALRRQLNEQGYKEVDGCNTDTLNLLDYKAVEQYFLYNRPQTVALLATRHPYDIDSVAHMGRTMLQNMAMQNNVFEMCYKYEVQKVVFFASDSVLPFPPTQAIMTESDIGSGSLNSFSGAYSWAKLAGIKLCEFLNEELLSRRYVAVLPTHIYGDYHSGLMFSLFESVIKAKQTGNDYVEVWGSPDLMYNFIHANDVANAVLFLMQNDMKYDSYIIAPDCMIKKSELMQLIAKIVGYSGKIVFNAARSVGQSVRLSAERLNAEGWRPSMPLEVGLNDLYKWYCR